jgi:hypothetical protein
MKLRGAFNRIDRRETEKNFLLQWIAGEGELGDGVAGEEVFLDDAFEDFGGAGVVPGAFGVDDGDGAVDADLEAIGLGAVDEGVGAGEFEFLEAALEVIPGGDAFLLVAALGLGLVSAEEDMAFDFFDAQISDGCPEIDGQFGRSHFLLLSRASSAARSIFLPRPSIFLTSYWTGAVGSIISPSK